MRARARSSRVVFFLVLIFLIALPLFLDFLLGARVGKYLSWLESGISIGGTKITIINVAYLIIFLVFFTFLSRIIREALRNRVLPGTRVV
jgi:small-conductance mechanosensitive channel